MPLELSSSAFVHDGEIPARYTCDGEDTAPPLAWSGAPAGTKSFALIVDDPDAPDPRAPTRTYVHWVVFNLPPDASGVGGGAALTGGAREGKNDWGKSRYGGPCPPIGKHRYFFKLYALDATVPDRSSTTKADLEAAMRGHVLAHAELVGLYQRG